MGEAVTALVEDAGDRLVAFAVAAIREQQRQDGSVAEGVIYRRCVLGGPGADVSAAPEQHPDQRGVVGVGAGYRGGFLLQGGSGLTAWEWQSHRH